MRNTAYWRDKKVTIVGLARSGRACAELLRGLGCAVAVSDNQDTDATRKNAEALRRLSITVELGSHSRELLCGCDLIIVSPGVPDDALPLVWAKEQGIPAVSEIEAAWTLMPCPVIAVTGSSGKTTVTTLIGEVLRASGKRVHVLGNIGTPLSSAVADMRPGDYCVAEVSSFQLERIKTFKPRVAVVTNISKNHLDRYASMQDYIIAKKRIFINQDREDFLVINDEDRMVRDFALEARSQAVYFRADQELNANQACVTAVADVLGIPRSACRAVFNDFKGLEHRMEQVAIVRGVNFINDSKATTVESCIWALRSITQPVVLICGGRDKGVDYSLVVSAARRKVKAAVLIGEAKEKIRASLAGAVPVFEEATLPRAVACAFEQASAGDCVLLSPMCSSYDMFTDYEERGRVFKKAVNELAKG